ncbi:hypothetical protein ABIB68_007584 [Bradyrhizobium sp. F1.2.2]
MDWSGILLVVDLLEVAWATRRNLIIISVPRPCLGRPWRTPSFF